MIIKNEQEVLNHFEKLQLDKEPVKRENYGIFVNGKRIRLSNGKVVWNKKNHASTAMRNEFEQHLFPNSYVDYPQVRYGTPAYEEQWKERQKQRKFMEEMYDKLKDEGVIQFLPV